MPLPVRAIAPNSLARHAPQQFVQVHRPEVCDKCHAVDTFVSRCVVRGVAYLRCRNCGRMATRRVVIQK